MRLRGEGIGFDSRLIPIVALVLAGTIAVVLVILAPDLQWFLPDAIRRRRIGMALVALAATYAIARTLAVRRQAGVPSSHPLDRALDRVNALADVALSGGLTIIVAVTGLAFLATWLPHYLLWPWSRDADTFATLAQSWDAGIRPYRDIRGYNFPGAIYLSWVLGKSFGWGRTWALYAFDAAALVALGVILAAWSRRCLGRMFPGLAAYLVFLTFYLSRDFETVAQRDWHASLCVVLGLLILQAWPSRTSRILSALLCAGALAIRPHAGLFLPAMAAAVLEGAGRHDDGPRSRRAIELRWLAEWLLALGGFTVLAFAPLLVAGIADDLIRGLKVVAFGGPYNRANPATATQVLVEELVQPATRIVIGLFVVLLAANRGASRRRAVTWGLALSAALVYRLFHPVQHAYLIYPLTLVGSVAMALPIAWIIDRAGVPPPLRVLVVLALVVETSLGPPLFCDPSATVEAIQSLAHGEMLPIHSPPGSRAWFDPTKARWYAWEDYRDALIYLRRNTRPGTLVANVLKEPPFPAINGPTGRLSPFRAESGICWMWLVDIDLEPEFASSLEGADDSVVVWSPEEHKLLSQLRLDRLASVIRKRYRPEARFGHIEVWRRANEPPPGSPESPDGPDVRRSGDQ
jgi:hypothetical protein